MAVRKYIVCLRFTSEFPHSYKHNNRGVLCSTAYGWLTGVGYTKSVRVKENRFIGFSRISRYTEPYIRILGAETSIGFELLPKSLSFTSVQLSLSRNFAHLSSQFFWRCHSQFISLSFFVCIWTWICLFNKTCIRSRFRFKKKRKQRMKLIALSKNYERIGMNAIKFIYKRIIIITKQCA